MNANTTTWIRRVAAGAVLAAAPALIALGTAAASQAQTSPNGPGYSYSPQPSESSQAPWYQSSRHLQHQAWIQSYYQ